MKTRFCGSLCREAFRKASSEQNIEQSVFVREDDKRIAERSLLSLDDTGTEEALIDGLLESMD